MTQFRLGISDDQGTVITTAINAARVINGQDTNFRGKTWKGDALVFICKKFMDGIPPSVFKCIKDQETAIGIAKETGPLSGKDEYRIRQRIRDKWFKAQSRKDTGANACADTEKEIGTGTVVDTAKKEKQQRSNDDGRLFEASLLAGSRYLAQCNRSGEEWDDFTFYPFNDYARAHRQWSEKGGYLIRIRGDVRTITKNNMRPILWLWMSTDIDIPFHGEYVRLFSEIDNPSVEISEVVPNGGADWEPPMISNGRVKAQV